MGKCIDANNYTTIAVCKGLAILMIILTHIHQPLQITELTHNIFRLCQLGVQIFFVLSSYTLCCSLDNKNPTYLTFIKKRWRRIVPGYWTMIVIYFILGTISLSIYNENIFKTSTEWNDILINIFLLNGLANEYATNNTVVRGGWFIGTIIIFYYLTPLLFKIFNSKSELWQRHRLWLFPCIITCLSAFLIFILGLFNKDFTNVTNNRYAYFSFINQLPCFSIGFVLYAYKKEEKQHNNLLIALVGIVLFAVSVWLFFPGIHNGFVIIPTLFAISFSMFFILLSNMIEQYGTNCITNFLKKWGNYSFAIYLTHGFIVWDIYKNFIADFIYRGERGKYLILIIWILLAFTATFYLGKFFTKYLNFVDEKIIDRIINYEHKQ